MFSIQDSQIETRLFVIGIPIRAIVPSPAMGFREQALKMMHKTRKSESSLVQCRALAVVMEEGVLKRKSHPLGARAGRNRASSVAKMPVPGSDVGGPRHPAIEREIFTCRPQPHAYTNATRGAAGGPQRAMARRVGLHHGRCRALVQRIPEWTKQG